ncbi:MAG: Pycsar system effector family protein, partial [Mariniphaga sp.]
LAHLASKNYFDLKEKMIKEKSYFEQKELDEYQFLFQSLEFFMAHSFKTDYGQNVLQLQKEENEKELRKKLAKHLKIKKKKKKGKTAYSRGVESMFRLTARNQINLSAIADNKSNILISVNAILISVILSVLVTRISQIPEFILPTLIFLLTCVATIIFSILSTRPNISSGQFVKSEIAENKVNLLFFGNFYKMKLEDYEWGINQLMQNDKNLYSTMIKDQYYLGKILAKKYKLLKVAYNVFLVGVILSAIAFGWVALNIYFVS